MENDNKVILFKKKLEQIKSISNNDFLQFTTQLKPRFSIPLTTDYIDKINPRIVECETKEDKYNWDVIHKFQSLHDGVNICGRSMKFLVINETDDTFLGVIRFNLFLPKIKLIDKMVGWSNETKYNQKMYQKIVNLQTLVSTQPFGFNCLGGKLLTSISSSKEVTNFWKQKYGDIFSLVTMSLTGGLCQYTRLKSFKHIGNILGDSKIERGIYWCNLYDNSLSLLRNETTSIHGELKSIGEITTEWKKHSKKRISTLIEQNRLSIESNTYDKYFVTA